MFTNPIFLLQSNRSFFSRVLDSIDHIVSHTVRLSLITWSTRHMAMGLVVLGGAKESWDIVSRIFLRVRVHSLLL